MLRFFFIYLINVAEFFICTKPGMSTEPSRKSLDFFKISENHLDLNLAQLIMTRAGQSLTGFG